LPNAAISRESWKRLVLHFCTEPDETGFVWLIASNAASGLWKIGSTLHQPEDLGLLYLEQIETS
jgi:hypothetical protein